LNKDILPLITRLTASLSMVLISRSSAETPVASSEAIVVFELFVVFSSAKLKIEDNKKVRLLTFSQMTFPIVKLKF